ncbi:hypothetical protein [Rhizobium tubonense]|uniref:Uncharacterized protein n=1 Tax=Rhizobium tubonense TaxID=484088 RepID=A0A2W4D577_9HYPH|nr:hypothetical protein [Rhizobium tubonense]PZM17195.1 hypothetical protein CPY51_02920 [Rhizobium tubonense]
MKKMILLAAFAMLASNAMAMSRHDSSSLTCSAIHDKIAQEGSIVLRYPSHRDPNLMMYNRYVANSMSCIGQGSMSSATVPTRDDPNCKVRMCNPVTGKGPNKNH